MTEEIQAEPQPEPPAEAESPAEAPRPRRRGLWIAIALIAVLVIAGAAFGYLRYTQQEREAQARAELRDDTKKADELLADVWEHLEVRDRAWGQTSADTAGIGLVNMIDLTTEDLAARQKTVDEVRAIAEGMPDEAVSSAYLKVCDELDTQFDDVLAGIEGLSGTSEQIEKLGEADAECEMAWGYIQTGIDQANAKKYSDSEATAKKAQASYEKALKIYETANAVLKDAEVGYRIEWTKMGVDYAKAEAQIAVAGRKHSSASTYNAQIKKFNALQAKMADHPGDTYEPETGFDDAKSAAADLVLKAKAAQKLWGEAQDKAEDVLIGLD